jgi:hypothetical protein
MEKIKVDAFIDLGICQLLINTQFDLSHSDDEKAAWNAFQQDVTGFF